MCYSTLWGQIHRAALLPTADRAHFCLLENQVEKVDIGLFYHSFQSEYMQLRHFTGDGVYVIEKNHHKQPIVELILFRLDEEVSFLIVLVWINYNYINCTSKMSTNVSDGNVVCCHRVAIGHHRLTVFQTISYSIRYQKFGLEAIHFQCRWAESKFKSIIMPITGGKRL